MSQTPYLEPQPSSFVYKEIPLAAEDKNQEHQAMLVEYCKTGVIPAGWKENTTFLEGRTETRNCVIEKDGQRIVFNGGRYRFKNDKGEWESKAVDVSDVYAPKVKNLDGNDKVMGGGTIIGEDGVKRSYGGIAPLGGFWTPSLVSKIENTILARKIAEENNIDVEIPIFTAAIEYEIEGKNVAAAVYALPVCEIHSDYLEKTENTFEARYKRYYAIGAFARAGLIHPQLHGGNGAVVTDPDGHITTVISDWEGAYDVTEFPEDKRVDLGFGAGILEVMVTPREKAEIFSLVTAVKADLVSVLQKKFDTKDQLETYIVQECISPMLLGFLGLKRGDPVDLPALQNRLVKESMQLFNDENNSLWSVISRFSERHEHIRKLLRILDIPNVMEYAMEEQKTFLSEHLLISMLTSMSLVLVKREPVPMQMN